MYKDHCMHHLLSEKYIWWLNFPSQAKEINYIKESYYGMIIDPVFILSI